MRRLAAALLVAALAAAAPAQTGSYSRAAPPDPAALDRLNLTSEWAVYLPVSGRQDGLARVQVVDDTQVFVQTRSGVLIAVDAKTGREQWKYRYPAAFTDGFLVATNGRFVYSVNVAKLFCHQRYTGTLEFEVNLPETPAAGPVTDGDDLYLAYTGAKVGRYQLPPSFRTSTLAPRDPADRTRDDRNPADGVIQRNTGRTFGSTGGADVFERPQVPREYFGSNPGLSDNQVSPSMSTLQTVVPPYVLGGLNKVVSVSVLPSLRPPYSARPEYMTHNQLTPSVAAIPPSLARVFEMTNLRPPPFEPTLLWQHATQSKVNREPLFVPDNARSSARLWVTEDSRTVQVMTRESDPEARPIAWTLPAAPAGRLVGPFGYTPDALLGVLPLEDGQVLGMDLTGGTTEGPRYLWRANVGGPLNRTPVAAADGVYVGGDDAGCARINVTTGEVDWRTTGEVDRIAAVTADHVYARDHRGTLVAYDKGRVADRVTFRARPVGTLAAADFGVNVTNTATDRIVLAADNGLVVCLRDAGPKNAKVKQIAPPPPPFDPAKPAAPAAPADDTVKPVDPKKDEPKK